MPAPADWDFLRATIDNVVLALDKRSEAGVELVHIRGRDCWRTRAGLGRCTGTFDLNQSTASANRTATMAQWLARIILSTPASHAAH